MEEGGASSLFSSKESEQGVTQHTVAEEYGLAWTHSAVYRASGGARPVRLVTDPAASGGPVSPAPPAATPRRAANRVPFAPPPRSTDSSSSSTRTPGARDSSGAMRARSSGGSVAATLPPESSIERSASTSKGAKARTLLSEGPFEQAFCLTPPESEAASSVSAEPLPAQCPLLSSMFFIREPER